MNTIGHYIQGQQTHRDGATLDVYNPATDQCTSQVNIADQSVVADAVSAAKSMLPEWSRTPVSKRAEIMYRFKQLLESNLDPLCELIGQEHGKIKHDALGELSRGIENVAYASGLPSLLKGSHSKQVAQGIDSWSERHPVGVVAGITPFNFPVMVPLWMIPLALTCGNTFVLKPSEKTPSAMMLVADLLKQAGLPDGVFNIVHGDHTTATHLITHPDISAVSFVGSTKAAKQIYQLATSHDKRCQALGGAKNHAMVMPDADIDNTANQMIGAAYGSSGERCMALSVAVTVNDDTADQLVATLKEKIATLKVGSCADDSNDLGPLISRQHQLTVTSHIDSAEAEGATIVADGRHPTVEGSAEGYYVAPTLIDNVTTGMSSYQAEIFGPVLQVVRTQSFEEAIQIMNAHPYGNGTCIFTRDGETARLFSEQIQAGMVGINVPLPVPVSHHSFGGWKQSLWGDLHAYGPEGIHFYTKLKTITQRWPKRSDKEAIALGFPSS